MGLSSVLSFFLQLSVMIDVPGESKYHFQPRLFGKVSNGIAAHVLRLPFLVNICSFTTIYELLSSSLLLGQKIFMERYPSL